MSDATSENPRATPRPSAALAEAAAEWRQPQQRIEQTWPPPLRAEMNEAISGRMDMMNY